MVGYSALDKWVAKGYQKVAFLCRRWLIRGPIAQLAEPPAHNRSVPGSIPGGPTIIQAGLKRAHPDKIFKPA